MRSKRSHEGYFLIDHRASPGLPGLPKVFEAPVVTCSHCHVQVIINPDRVRERAWCAKCDHYICDKCDTVRRVNGGECLTMNQLFDQLQESAARG